MPDIKLTDQILELSECMRKQPNMTDSKLLIAGARSLAIVCDDAFGPATPRYKDCMQSLYLEVIGDLAHGAPLLCHHTLGISYKNQKLVPFSLPFSESDLLEDGGAESLGKVVCSIDLKAEAESLSQDDVDAAIYLLAYYISRL